MSISINPNENNLSESNWGLAVPWPQTGHQQAYLTQNNQHYEVGLSPLILGRDPSCEIVLDSPLVSRFHCVVYRWGNQVWVRDLHSTNGIHLNGQNLEMGKLEWGDQLELGESRFQLSAGGLLLDAYPSHAIMLNAQLDTHEDQTQGMHWLMRFADRIWWHRAYASLNQSLQLEACFGLWPNAHPADEALATVLAALEYAPQSVKIGLSVESICFSAGEMRWADRGVTGMLAQWAPEYGQKCLFSQRVATQLENARGLREVDTLRWQGKVLTLYTWDERLARSREFLFGQWYNEGLKSYRNGEWLDAARLWQQGASAGDNLSAQMLGRLLRSGNQAPQHWKGIWEI